jgi:methionyl aminopeptidase
VPEACAANVPDYAADGNPRFESAHPFQLSPPCLDAAGAAKARAVARLGRHILDAAHALVRPGITTDELDRCVHEITIEAGAYPAPLNYRNFPKSVCTSVNEVVCHGIPDSRELQDGDIVNVDVSAILDGCVALRRVASRRVASRCVALRCVALRCVALRCVSCRVLSRRVVWRAAASAH